jgi:5'-AMP-activated protein kinase regulatory gamma subunit|mmetsp:Transcript_22778/g.64151  ORF Transcript_22778/g.64151 Transcript_22778/m.64151 type:complete len:341 (+) Transcript_22778:3631-4653(+)
MINEREVLKAAGRSAITTFLHSQIAFELVRISGKVVVFETNIPIQLAFYALLEHESSAAPLWDSSRREFVGLMTITDFVDILLHYHDQHGRTGAAIEVLASRSIAQVLSDPVAGTLFKHATEMFAQPSPLQPPSHDHAVDYGGLIAVDANGSLYDACGAMRTNKRRYLPIVTSEDCGILAVVTHVDILEYFVATFREERRLFDQPIQELGIGTFDEVMTVNTTTSLEDVLKLLCRRNLSSVPVVDKSGRIVSLYNHSDITFLATATDADSVVVNLGSSIEDVIAQRRSDEPLHTCSQCATLQFVFEFFADVKFRRLICLDVDRRPVGIISVRDLLSYFVD